MTTGRINQVLSEGKPPQAAAANFKNVLRKITAQQPKLPMQIYIILSHATNETTLTQRRTMFCAGDSIASLPSSPTKLVSSQLRRFVTPSVRIQIFIQIDSDESKPIEANLANQVGQPSSAGVQLVIIGIKQNQGLRIALKLFHFPAEFQIFSHVLRLS